MINIQFGSSNSSQIKTFWLEIKGHPQDVYITQREMPQLIDMLKDIRNMSDEEFTSILSTLQSA